MKKLFFGMASLFLIVSVGATFVFNVQADMIDTLRYYIDYFNSLVVF